MSFIRRIQGPRFKRRYSFTLNGTKLDFLRFFCTTLPDLQRIGRFRSGAVLATLPCYFDAFSPPPRFEIVSSGHDGLNSRILESASRRIVYSSGRNYSTLASIGQTTPDFGVALWPFYNSDVNCGTLSGAPRLYPSNAARVFTVVARSHSGFPLRCGLR